MYIPGQLQVTVGSLIISGLIKGTAVTYKRNVPRVSTSIGLDGLGTDVVSSDNSGLIEITCQQSSPFVASLNALAKSLARQFCTVFDPSSGSEVAQGMGRVIGEADGAFAETLGERKFTITLQRIDISGGGGHEP